MKKFFSIITASIIVLFTTSCSKTDVLAQVGQEATSIPSPRIVRYGPGTADVEYNGRTVTLTEVPVATSTAIIYGCTGFMTEPLTKPLSWDLNATGTAYIANGSQPTGAAMWYVQNHQLMSRTMTWNNTPNTGNDWTAYVPGSYLLKRGWISPVYSIKIWYSYGTWTWSIMN